MRTAATITIFLVIAIVLSGCSRDRKNVELVCDIGIYNRTGQNMVDVQLSIGAKIFEYGNIRDNVLSLDEGTIIPVKNISLRYKLNNKLFSLVVPTPTGKLVPGSSLFITVETPNSANAKIVKSSLSENYSADSVMSQSGGFNDFPIFNKGDESTLSSRYLFGALANITPAGKLHVIGIIKGSTADDIGLRLDDLITNINGQEVTGHESFDVLWNTICPGAAISILVRRNGMNFKLAGYRVNQPKEAFEEYVLRIRKYEYEKVAIQCIQKARKSIMLKANVITSERIANALDDARKNKIDIKIIICEGEFTAIHGDDLALQLSGRGIDGRLSLENTWDDCMIFDRELILKDASAQIDSVTFLANDRGLVKHYEDLWQREYDSAIPSLSCQLTIFGWKDAEKRRAIWYSVYHALGQKDIVKADEQSDPIILNLAMQQAIIVMKNLENSNVKYETKPNIPAKQKKLFHPK
jgi:hypothetical protein